MRCRSSAEDKRRVATIRFIDKISGLCVLASFRGQWLVSVGNCVRRLILAVVISVCGLGASAAGAGVLQLKGQIPGDPTSPAFDVFANLTNPLHPSDPFRPDLTDATRPTLHIDTIQNHVLFDFGMIAPGGLPVTFDTPSIVPSDFDSLLLHTQAHFGTDSFFDVQFTAFFTVNEAPVKPLSAGIPGTPYIPADPAFPNGSLQLDFAATSDPPFTIEFSLLDSNGNFATLTAVPVPEPGSLVLWGFGMTLLGGWSKLRRKLRATCFSRVREVTS